MKSLKTGIVALSLVLLAGCSGGFDVPKIKDTSEKIIQINNSYITKQMLESTLNNEYNSSALASRNVNLKLPQNRVLYIIFQNKVINDLIVKALLDQEAEKRKITVNQGEINSLINKIADKVGGKSKLEASLTLNNIDKGVFVNNLRSNIIIKKLIDSSAGNTEVSENAVLDYYNKNKAKKFLTPDSIRAQHILISASPQELRTKLKAENPKISDQEINKKIQADLNKAKAKAENILGLLKANPSKFSDLARTYSDDSNSAVKGGDLGYFSKDSMVPAFSDAAFSLSAGQISNIVQTPYGYHIIKLVDRRKAGIVPYVELKSELKRYLTEQKRLAVLQNIVKSAKDSAKISYLDKQYDINTLQNELKTLTKGKSNFMIQDGGMLQKVGK